jgi:hypothetical protein
MEMNEFDRERANDAKLEQLKEVLKKLPPKVFQRGFHGNVWIEAKIQDGVIQHATTRVDESMK